MRMPSLDTVIPYFQPIISADEQEVFAYEVLARELLDGKACSLGPFFESKKIPDSVKFKLDMHVGSLAMEAYVASGSKSKLFINLKPSWVYAYKGQNTPFPTLLLIEKFGIDPRNVVIEVTEEDLMGDYEVLGRLLAEYRREGCLLAIDDFGKGASNFERIAHVMPDIIKIDKSIIPRMDSYRSFFDICHAMASFGDVAGFDLLFEGVETASQLESCVAAKGRYFQGYVFSRVRAEIDEPFENQQLLRDIFSIRLYREGLMLQRREEVSCEMEWKIENLRLRIPAEEEKLRQAGALQAFGAALPYYCIRCFICDRSGRQLSHIYSLEPGGAVTVQPGESSAWMLRNFFSRGMDMLHGGRVGVLSVVYKNVDTKEDVVTYMHMLGNDRILCVDILSSFFV